MLSNKIHALVLVQNWGDTNDLMEALREYKNISSVYHIMGRHSYLIDAYFDNKQDLVNCIRNAKAIKLSSGVPALVNMQTLRIIDVFKQKEDYSLKDYHAIEDSFHFFVKLDVPNNDEKLIRLLKKNDAVTSVLHVQGEVSYVIEVITNDYEKYRELIRQIKKLRVVGHIETQEVIKVIKYRNQIIDETGNLIEPIDDIRELYSL